MVVVSVRDEGVIDVAIGVVVDVLEARDAVAPFAFGIRAGVEYEGPVPSRPR